MRADVRSPDHWTGIVEPRDRLEIGRPVRTSDVFIRSAADYVWMMSDCAVIAFLWPATRPSNPRLSNWSAFMPAEICAPSQMADPDLVVIVKDIKFIIF